MGFTVRWVGAAMFFCFISEADAGAVGGPRSITVSLGYMQNNTRTVAIEFEGGGKARVVVSSDVRGYSVVYGPDGKQFYGKFGPIEGEPGRWGIEGEWTPETTSTFNVNIINDDNDAKKDATFLIETN